MLCVLCHSDSDTMSGALVARHLGSLPIAASIAFCSRHKLDRWVSFARKWQRKNDGASSWVATSAERELLIKHGATVIGRPWLLKVQVIDTSFMLSRNFMPVGCAACLGNMHVACVCRPKKCSLGTLATVR